MRQRRYAVLGVALILGLLIGTGLLAGSALPAGARGARAAVIVRPGQSIQAAVDAAAPGTTIIVRPGTYAEHVTITTDGISLRGFGATLVPPDEHPQSPCSFGGESTDGICAIGELDFSDPQGPPVVTDPVSDVTISGFTVEGFAGIGIFFFGAENPVVTHNRTDDNGAYGIARFFSTGGKILGNKASGSEEAGIYVGDSPDANVLIVGNETFDNGLFGFFLRDAANGRLAANRSHDNCVGAIVLNTGGNVAGDWRFTGNSFKENNEFCPADDEEGTPPLSGIGVLIANGADNTLKGNLITGNVPSGDVLFSGGVVVVDAGSPGANPPSGNVVQGNVILRNEPDIFWDGSGEGNVFRANLCETSVPDGLC
jgi:parallel beta-helix repeat protein